MALEAEDTAIASINHMNTLMDQAQIKIAEIKARLVAIQEHLDRTEQSIRERLEEQFIQYTIELAGQEAQRTSIHKTLEQQNRLISLISEYAALKLKVEILQKDIQRNQGRLDNYRLRLNGADENLYPPLAGNRVTIHPIAVRVMK